MITIIEENDDFIVAYKPAGVGFHNEGQEQGFFNLLKEQINQQIYSVHRLDKVTSGLILIAKTSEIASLFGEKFQEHKIHKYYIALAEKKPKKKQGLIKGNISKGRRGAWKFGGTVTNLSVTQFFSYAYYPGTRLYILKPHTGKTHQLRVVMKSLGVPIKGDTLYGADHSDRVYLHAYALEFNFKNKQYYFEQDPIEGEGFKSFINIIKEIGKPNKLNWPKI